MANKKFTTVSPKALKATAQFLRRTFEPESQVTFSESYLVWVASEVASLLSVKTEKPKLKEPEIFSLRRRTVTCEDGVHDKTLSDVTTEYVRRDAYDALQTALSDERRRREGVERERDAAKDSWLAEIDLSKSWEQRATLAESRAERVRRETIEECARACERVGGEEMSQWQRICLGCATAIRALSAAGREG